MTLSPGIDGTSSDSSKPADAADHTVKYRLRSVLGYSPISSEINLLHLANSNDSCKVGSAPFSIKFHEVGRKFDLDHVLPNLHIGLDKQDPVRLMPVRAGRADLNPGSDAQTQSQPFGTANTHASDSLGGRQYRKGHKYLYQGGNYQSSTAGNGSDNAVIQRNRELSYPPAAQGSSDLTYPPAARRNIEPSYPPATQRHIEPSYPLATHRNSDAAYQPARPLINPISVPVSRVPDSQLTMSGAPTITPEKIDEVLRQYHSPAAGMGRYVYDQGVKHGINPAMALAFFVVESGAGTHGVAVRNRSWGNVIGSDGHGYHRFHSFKESLDQWYDLISNKYLGEFHADKLGQVISHYAPHNDGNHEAHYAHSVGCLVRKWATN